MSIMNCRKILNVVGLGVAVSVSSLVLVGCGDKGVNSGDGNYGNLSVNGAQVYNLTDNDNLIKSNYSGSFDYVDGGESRLTDFFTDPVVRITQGKLSINLGVPNKLMPISIFSLFDFWDLADNVTISDYTAKIFPINYFYGEDAGELILFNPNTDLFYEVAFVYADKDVTISGSMYYGTPFSLDLHKGWNITVEGEGNEGVRTVDIDISGSGVYKWVCGDGDCDE